jgi:hypothetical protein
MRHERHMVIGMLAADRSADAQPLPPLDAERQKEQHTPQAVAHLDDARLERAARGHRLHIGLLPIETLVGRASPRGLQIPPERFSRGEILHLCREGRALGRRGVGGQCGRGRVGESCHGAAVTKLS